MRPIKTIALFVLLGLTSLGHGQTVLTSFSQTTAPDTGLRKLASISEIDGSVSLIGSNIDSNGIGTSSGVTTINIADELYYLIANDSGTSKLYAVDINGAAAAVEYELAAGFTQSTVFGIWHNKTSNRLYAYATIPGNGNVGVYEITLAPGAPNTATFSLLADLGPLTVASGLITGDFDNDRLFVLADDGGEGQLYQVADLTSSPFVDGPFPLEQSVSNIFGAEYRASDNTVLFVAGSSVRSLHTFLIDDQEVGGGSIELNNGFSIALSSGQTAFDQQTDTFYLLGNPSDGVSNQGNSLIILDASQIESQQVLNGSNFNSGTSTGIDVQPGPNLSVTKTDDVAVSASPGDTISYTIDISNAADAGRASGVVLTETVPTDTTFDDAATTAAWACAGGGAAGQTCTLSRPDIAPGGTDSVDFAVTIDASVSASTSAIGNTVSVAAANSATTPQATESTPVDATAVISVTKTADTTDITPEDTVTYTITAENTGNRDADGAVLTETVPANATFQAAGSSAFTCLGAGEAGDTCTLALGTLAGGSMQMATFVIDVDSSVAPELTDLSNKVDLDTTTPALSDSFTLDTPVTASVTLGISKDDGPTTTASPGDLLTYTIDYGNTGNRDAGETTITETVPDQTTFSATNSTPGWTCPAGGGPGDTCSLSLGTLPGGDAGSIAFAVEIDNPIDANTTAIDNTAFISATNGLAEMAMTSTPLASAPTLSLAKTTGGITSVSPGGTPSFTMTYANTGNEDAANVVISDIVPAQTTFVPEESSAGWDCGGSFTPGSTCQFAVGDLAGGGASGLVVFTLRVDDSVDVATDTITNVATLDADNADSVNAQDSVTVVSEASLAVSITEASSGPFAPGDTVIYNVEYANTGSQDTDAAQLTIDVPTNTQFNAGQSNAGWNCAATTPGSVCSLDVGTQAGGDSATLTYAVDIDSPYPKGAPPLGISVDYAASNAATATAADSTTLAGIDLQITKDDGQNVLFDGQVVTYIITVRNLGTVTAASATVSDILPPNLLDATWFCDAIGGASCTTSGSGDITDTVSIPPNDAVIYALTATVDFAGDSSITNTATVEDAPEQIELDPSNNIATDTGTTDGVFRDRFEASLPPPP
jgi:uncharacterized repeat protein (TIGR01451 family)